MKRIDKSNDIDRRIEALLRAQEEFRKSQVESHKKIDEVLDKLAEEQRKTDEQLKKTDEQLKKTDEQLKKTNEQLKKTDEHLKKTDEQLKKTDEHLKKTDEQLKKTDEQLKKTDEQLKKTNEQIRELIRKTDEELRKTDEQLKRLGKQIGELTDGWGKFVLGLSEPGIEMCLKKIGFSTYGIISSVLRRIKDKEYEIDLLCPCRLNGKTIIIVIEAKSYLNQQKVNNFIQKLKRFHEFFPEYGNIEVIGGMAGIRLASGIKALVLKEGLYLFSVSGEVMKSLTPKEFKPKIW